MTTPPTPAGWYPDPEDSASLRYWDGATWTEHRAPANPSAPEQFSTYDTDSSAGEQPTSVVRLPDESTSPPAEQASAQAPSDEATAVVPLRESADDTAAASASDTTRSTASDATPEQPAAQSFGWNEPASFEPPMFETFETPSFESISSGSFEAPAAPPPSSGTETPYTGSSDAGPTDDTPITYQPPAPPASFNEPYEAPFDQNVGDQTTSVVYPAATPAAAGPGESAAWNAPGAAPPAGPSAGFEDRSANDGSRGLLMKYLVGIGVLALILIAVLVYALAFHNDASQSTASSSSRSSTPTTDSPTSTTASDTSAPSSAPPVGGDATEGPFTFSVSGTDSGTTITSEVDPSVQKTATGEYFVVYVNVGNNGPDPLTFATANQILKSDDTAFAPDDAASIDLGGGAVTINPGQVVETAVAFDVPVGTTPTSIEFHGVEGGTGVDVPL
jgi:hypothetical protein